MPEDDPIVFSPEAFTRHDQAVRYVDGLSRTRNPRDQADRYPRIIPAAWGLLAAGGTISAASGLTLGSGSVKLCDRSGTVPDGAPDVDVANAGKQITGGDTGKIVPLEWVENEWVACGCGGVCPCSPCDIPEVDLNLSAVVGGVPTLIGKLIYAGSCLGWAFNTGFTEGDVSITLQCSGGSISILYALFNPPYTGTTILDFTCTPFHFHVRDIDGNFWDIDGP